MRYHLFNYNFGITTGGPPGFLGGPPYEGA
jgi:hypothetical protein